MNDSVNFESFHDSEEAGGGMEYEGGYEIFPLDPPATGLLCPRMWPYKKWGCVIRFVLDFFRDVRLRSRRRVGIAN